MQLVSVYSEVHREAILYQLLLERPVYSRISHNEMPTQEEHQKFVCSEPFRYWLFIQEFDRYLGAIEVTDRNEIGISLFQKYQGHGHAHRALSMFLAEYQPLPALLAIRNGRWLANISPSNAESKAFFARSGFVPIQETWVMNEAERQVVETQQSVWREWK